MEYSILGYLWFFVIYAFLGWCVEVAFHTVTSGKFVNRGFLNGPVCPVYGFGMIILIFSLSSLVDNFILLFLGAFLLTSSLELITGYILEKVFNSKWWDYSDLPFNIKGYISLSFSIVWGLASVFMLNIIHPPISKFVLLFNNTIGNILLVLIIIFFIADFIITIFGIMKINKRIRILDDISVRLRLYSDDIGENIYKGMTVAIKAKDNIHEKLEDSKSGFETGLNERKVNISELKAKYNNLLKEKHFVHKRLEKAFPNLRRVISNFENNKKSK